MINGKGTFLFLIQVHAQSCTHIPKDEYTCMGYTFQYAQTQAHTAQRHTLTHSHSHNKYVCNGKAHACFTHTLPSNRNTQRDTQIYIQGPSFSNAHRHAGISDRGLLVTVTNTDTHSHSYLGRDTHPLSQPPPIHGLWRGKLHQTLSSLSSPRGASLSSPRGTIKG